MQDREPTASEVAARRRSYIASLLVDNPTLVESKAEVHRLCAERGWKVSLDAIGRDLTKIKGTRAVEERERELQLISIAMSTRLTPTETLTLLATSQPPIVMSRITLWRRQKELQRIRVKAITKPLDDMIAAEVEDLRSMERQAAQEATRASEAEDRRRWLDTRLRIKAQIAERLALNVQRPMEVPAGATVLGMVPITQIVVERTAPAPKEEEVAHET